MFIFIYPPLEAHFSRDVLILIFMLHPSSIFLRGANCCKAPSCLLVQSHYVGHHQQKPYLSGLGEFIYLWQAHVSSHTLILCSCQKPVQYAFPPCRDTEAEGDKAVRACVRGVCVQALAVCVCVRV